MTMLTRRKLLSTYNALHRAFGAQQWWPADSPFEVMVGAVLTQNTAWSNVERAIGNLVERDKLNAVDIVRARNDHLALWLRPSGYFNIKAQRLKNFCRWYLEQGGYRRLARLGTDDLRRALLSVNGVGHETADDILLYAFERPVFVIDAYTRRLFARLGLVAGDEPYDELRLALEGRLGEDVALFNEYHALIVRHAKENCRVRPRCNGCVLRRSCRFVNDSDLQSGAVA